MQTPLLEILREIPDHRRAMGRRFELATVLLYSIIAMVGGANSYRQMHEFIRIRRQSLNAAFGLDPRYSPSYTGLRLILRAVDPKALETAFRRHASTIKEPSATEGLTAIAVDGKTLRGSFDAFCDRKAAHVMVAEKSNEIPTAPELIEALGVKDRLFTLDAEHCQKNCSSA
jgi:DDE_Tnp_1-associated